MKNSSSSSSRRNFFQKCGLFVAGCALGLGLRNSKVAVADSESLAQCPDSSINEAIPNPAYKTAEYEIAFYASPEGFKSIQFDPKKENKFVKTILYKRCPTA